MTKTTNCVIPLRTLASLEAYKEKRSPGLGGFLTAVLANDLVSAVRRADKDNLQALPVIVAYAWNELPGGAWGTYEKVISWLEVCHVNLNSGE